MGTKTSNNRGVTLLYVLMALMAVSFIGLNLIELAGTDAKAGAYYGAIESARMAVNSGFNATTTYFQAEENTVAFDKLLNQINDHSNAEGLSSIPDSSLWILGDENNYVHIPHSKSYYRVKLEGLDRDKMVAHFRVESKSRGGSKSSGHGLYYLEGLEIVSDTFRNTNTPATAPLIQAMHLEQANYNMNCSLVVNGDSYFGGKVTMNNKGKVFNGKVIAGLGSNDTTTYNSSVTFNDITYIGNPTTFGKTTIFNKSAGFDGKITSTNGNNNPQFGNGDVYFNAGLTLAGFNKSINLGGHNLFAAGPDANYQNSAGMSSPNPGTAIENISTNVGNLTKDPAGGSFSILTALGLTPPTSSIEIDTTEIVQHIYKTVVPNAPSQQIDASIMNSWYTNCITTGTDWNGYMVLRGFSGSMSLCKVGSGIFTGKVIWIIENSDLRNWYDADPNTSSQFVYMRKSSKYNTNHGGYTNFRGFIYCDDQNTDAGFISAAKDCHIKGGLFVAQNAYHAYNNDGAPELMEITYDSIIINEYRTLGLFYDPTDTSSGSTGEEVIDSIVENVHLKPGYSHLIPKLLSRTY